MKIDFDAYATKLKLDIRIIMEVYEQKMCELQGEIFEESASYFTCGSSFFISRYMYSEIVKNLDNVNDSYNYISPINVMHRMEDLYPSLKSKGGVKYPKPVMRWIGYIYRAYSIIKKKESRTIYKLLKSEKLLSLYDSFHTFSAEYCVERLSEIIDNNHNYSFERDYEIFKEIMSDKTNK